MGIWNSLLCPLVLLLFVPGIPAQRTNDAVIPAPQGPRMDANFIPKHEANVARAKQGNIDLLFIGDSIMQGWPSSGDWGKEVWEKYYNSQYNAAVFAVGYDRTQHVLWRMQNGEGEGYQPKVIQLLIGTNNLGPNTPAETIEGEKAVLADLQKRFPAARILITAIFPRGRPGDSIRNDVAAVNDALSKMADGRKVFYIDIGKIFLNEDETTNDGLKRDMLHPSAKGYQLWADAVKPTLDKLLADAGVAAKAH
jgi:lysophospholipase L1-like esterase